MLTTFMFCCSSTDWIDAYFKNCATKERKSIQKAQEFRKKGNDFFKVKDYNKACEMYSEVKCPNHVIFYPN